MHGIQTPVPGSFAPIYFWMYGWFVPIVWGFMTALFICEVVRLASPIVGFTAINWWMVLMCIPCNGCRLSEIIKQQSARFYRRKPNGCLLSPLYIWQINAMVDLNIYMWWSYPWMSFISVWALCCVPTEHEGKTPWYIIGNAFKFLGLHSIIAWYISTGHSGMQENNIDRCQFSVMLCYSWLWYTASKWQFPCELDNTSSEMGVQTPKYIQCKYKSIPWCC